MKEEEQLIGGYVKKEWPQTGQENNDQERGGDCWSGREDSNLRPPAPKAGALARLRYAPNFNNTGYHTEKSTNRGGNQDLIFQDLKVIRKVFLFVS